ncbi:MAG: alpha/beta hydrolase [Lachnospiraceae bacterium]|nr:alpha/beta hydrolase [Lachnospiraceae bacterium]
MDEVQKNARKADLPILLCQAGLETIVDNSGQDDFTKSAPNVRFVRFPKSKHEIFLSTADVLETYYNTLFEFLR